MIRPWDVLYEENFTEQIYYLKLKFDGERIVQDGEHFNIANTNKK